MKSEILTLAIIGHLVGDYLLQNDWMAQNKKKRSWPCVVHCLIWTGCVMVFTGWFAINSIAAPLTMLVLFGTHFLQDRTQIIMFWMTRMNRQPAFAQPPMAPWSIIVVDNVWHIVTIAAVWRCLQ